MIFPGMPSTCRHNALATHVLLCVLAAAPLLAGGIASADITDGYVIRMGEATAGPGSQVEIPFSLYRGDDAIAAGQAAAAVQFEIVFDATVLSFVGAEESVEVSNLYGKSTETSAVATGRQRILLLGLNDLEITSYDGATLIRPFPLGTITFNVIGTVGETSDLEVEELVCAAADATELTMSVGQDGSFEVVSVPTGSLKVTLQPAGARTAGAQWRVDDGPWRVSSVTVADLSVGQHTVSFRPITGWNVPADRTVTINDGLITNETGTYTEAGSGGCGKSVKRMSEKMAEEVLPLSRGVAETAIAASASPAVRLSSPEGIDPSSAWAALESAGASIAGSATFVINAEDDGWVVFTPDAPLPAGQVITLTVGATGLSGENVGPVAEQFLVEAEKTATSLDPSLVPAPGINPLPQLLAAPASPVYRLGPAGVFLNPVLVRIPLPEGSGTEDLNVYYFSESARHRGWYQGLNVTGWMVPNSLRIVSDDDTNYVEFLANHSGVVQLGKLIEINLGSMGAVDVGATGSYGQWAALAGVLFILSIGLGGLRAAQVRRNCR
jgi:hypothetical protein